MPRLLLSKILLITLVIFAFPLKQLLFAQAVATTDHQGLEMVKRFKKMRNPNVVLQALDSLGDLSHVPQDSLRAALYYYKGSALGQINAFDSALFYLEKTQLLIKGKGYDELEVFNYIAFGNVFWARQYVSLALEYYQRGLDICEKQTDVAYRQLEQLLLSNIGGVYARLENFDKALALTQKSINHLLAANPEGTAPRNYMKLGIYLTALERPEEGLENLKIGEMQAAKIGDSIALTHLYEAFAIAYIKLNHPKHAEEYAQKSLDVANALRYKFASPYFALANVYNIQRDFKSARLYVNQGLLIANEQKNINDQKRAAELFYQIALDEKDFRSALTYLNQVGMLNDSIKSVSRIKQVEEVQIRYETNKKELQIKELAQANLIKDIEAVNANQRQIFLVIGLGLLVLSILILYNRYQLKQKTARVLDEKNAELEKLNGFKDRMFAVISHDLRNPVHAFSTLMESLSQNVQHASKEELQEFLQSTLQSARDLQSLLNNLLEWALMQIGRLAFQPQAIPLKEVIKESARHVELMAEQKNIKIADETNGELAFADKAMLIIVIRNLLSNAIKFSGNNKQVTIEARQLNKNIQLAIRDQGSGMKPEELNKLFKQEESTQQIGNSQEKGAGIGLLLCKDLMDKNGGSIHAESVLGEGSVFYLELPMPQ